MTLERLTHRFVARHVPQNHGVVFARGGERFAIRAERDAPHPVLMTVERLAQRFAARHVPQRHRLVGARGGESLAIRAEGDALNHSRALAHTLMTI